MANNNKNKTGQNVGNQQNTTQTGGANNGGRKGDTGRTSNEGKKQSSGGSRKANNRGHQ